MGASPVKNGMARIYASPTSLADQTASGDHAKGRYDVIKVSATNLNLKIQLFFHFFVIFLEVRQKVIFPPKTGFSRETHD